MKCKNTDMYNMNVGGGVLGGVGVLSDDAFFQLRQCLMVFLFVLCI